MLMLLLVWRVQAEKALLVDRLETSQVLFVKAGRIFLLVLRSGLARGSPQQQPLVRMGTAFDPIQQTLWFFPWVMVLAQGVSLEHQQGKRLLDSFLPRGQLLLGKPPHQ